MNGETENEKQKTSLWRQLEQSLTPDNMFHDTEVQATKLGALILLCSGILLGLTMLLTACGVFPLSWETIAAPSIPALVEIAVMLAVCHAAHYDAWWLKYVLMLGLVIIYARLDSMLTHKAAILMVLPVVFSSRYFSRRLTVFTALLTTVVFFFSAAWGATHGLINLNIVTMPEGQVFVATGGFLGEAVTNAGVGEKMLIRNTILYDYLPKWLMFSIAAIISCNIARRGRDMVVDQHEEDVRAGRIKTELDLAARIQAAMLPAKDQSLPERKNLDLAGSMDPAKQVGGDFYDYYLIDDDHLCMVIADVSGKGIPAALSMMAVRIILNNNVKMGKSPAQALTDANRLFCARNTAGMFVTVWLGILELSTGKLTAANAGHEYPALRKPGGGFELLRGRHGLVLGAMDDYCYTEYTLPMEPGSGLFVYTDGLPEATDADGRMFGTDRMIAALNEDPAAPPERILKLVRGAVDGFVKDAEQFDDLTMLCMEYGGGPSDR